MALHWFVATLLGATIFGTGGFLIRLGSAKHEDGGLWVLLGLYLSGSAAFTVMAIVEGVMRPTVDVVLVGMLIGLGSVFGNVAWVNAFKYGPASLTGPVVNSYNILIIVMSVLFFGESLTVKELVAIGVILASVSLLSYDPNEELRIQDRRWFVFVLLAILLFFTRNGGLKIAEEAQYNNTALLAYGYMVGIIWFTYAIRKKSAPPNWSGIQFSLGWGLLSGLCSFGGLYLFSYSLAHGPASIISPVFSLNGLIFALLTITLMGERLSRYQTMALIGSTLGLILLRI